MTQTFSTRQREMSSGRLFSSRSESVVVPVPGSAVPAALPVPAASGAAILGAAMPGIPAPAVTGIRFMLSAEGIPATTWIGPGASGTVTVTETPGGPAKVSARIAGIGSLPDPGIRPVLWLIHDQPVPADLPPADLHALPHGPAGTGNRPGSLFTLDGGPPTYLPAPNTLAVAVSPGSLTPLPDGSWGLEAHLDANLNRAFHPFFFLGPGALADINASLPSGTVARIQTDLFMRPVTVYPELSLPAHFHQRLAAIVSQMLTSEPDRFLEAAQFTRAAVTLEGVLRSTPHLMPTRESCPLVSVGRTSAS